MNKADIIENRAKEFIAKSGYKPGDVLPLNHKLANQLDCTANELRNAFRMLVKQGCVVFKTHEDFKTRRRVLLKVPMEYVSAEEIKSAVQEIEKEVRDSLVKLEDGEFIPHLRTFELDGKRAWTLGKEALSSLEKQKLITFYKGGLYYKGCGTTALERFYKKLETEIERAKPGEAISAKYISQLTGWSVKETLKEFKKAVDKGLLVYSSHRYTKPDKTN